MLFPHDQGGWTLELPAVAWWALDLPGFFNYLLVLMTRLVLNLHTAYSDVGGTDTQSRADAYIRRKRLISKSDYNLKS